MKRHLLCVIAASVLILSIAACLRDKTAAAEGAAIDWLKSVDAGDYAHAWDAAAPIMKASISKEQWLAIAKEDRGSLGPLVSRKLTSSEYTQTSPGAPPGNYVVLQYQSGFAKKDGVSESVTLTEGSRGEWRVSLYIAR